MMIQHSRPVSGVQHGKSYRLAPFIENAQAAQSWKFAISKDELYAMNRVKGELLKYSFHFSGEAHMQKGTDGRQPITRPVRLSGEDWLHALEIRFLLSPDAIRPVEPIRRPDWINAIILPDPFNTVLQLNLLTATEKQPRPANLRGGRLLWESQLHSGYPVILIAGTAPMADDIRARLYEIRSVPKFLFERTPAPGKAYAEARSVHWSPAGNVALVVPLGAESLIVSPNDQR
jgi:hypothetical protein